MHKKTRVSKNNCYVFIVFLFVVGSCTNTKNIDSIEGVWKQTNYYHVADKDTVVINNNKIQHKVYLDGYVMWTSEPTEDLTEWHGFGTYSYENNILKENLVSMSHSLRGYTSSYSIDVKKSDHQLVQIIKYKQNDTIFQNIEVYKKIVSN